MPRALLSVYDKTGLVDFAQKLVSLGWDLVASGGTQKALVDAGLTVTGVEQVTKSPEMLGGRVKTLHPAIYAGILARDRAEDLEALKENGFAPINMVVCNLYPFQETVAKAGVTLQDAIEEIDIGGVTLLRAAAKNFLRVIPICDPADYERIAAALQDGGEVDLALRRALAVKVFALTRDYDTAIHAYLAEDIAPALLDHDLPEHLSLGMQKVETAALRRKSASSRRLLQPQSNDWTARRNGARRQKALLQQHPRPRRRVASRQQLQRPDRRRRQAPDADRRRHRCEHRRSLPGGVGIRPDLGLRRRDRREPDGDAGIRDRAWFAVR